MNIPTEDLELARMVLGAFVGLPLTSMYRYAGWQRFEFGIQKPAKNWRGKDITRADDALSVNCHWEIVRGDFRLSWSDFEPVRKDEHAADFYDLMGSDNPLVIESMEVNSRGGIRIAFHDGHVLTVTPNRSKKWEQWRYLPETDVKGHLVLQQGRIQWSLEAGSDSPA